MMGLSLGLGLVSRGKDLLSRYAINNAGGQPISPLAVWDAGPQIAAKSGGSIPLQTLFANTRNGTATYVDASGAVVTQTANNSITNHYIDGVAHALFQPSRVNAFTQSGDLDGSDWSGFRTSYAQGDSAPVLGEYFLTGTSTTTNSNGSAISAQDISNETADTYTKSFHAKAGPLDTGWLLVAVIDAASGANRAQGWFNIATGEAGAATVSGSGFSAPSIVIESILNGVYRANLTYTQAGTLDVSVRAYVADGNGAFGVTSGKDLQVWGAQSELGAFATTYIPTAGSEVTRLADAASCALTTLPIATGGGTIFIEGRAYYEAGAASGFERVFQIDDGTEANSIVLLIVTASSEIRVAIISAGSLQYGLSLGYTSGNDFNVGIRFEANNAVFSLNGASGSTDTSVTLPSGLDTVRWGTSSNGANNEVAVAIRNFRSFDHGFTNDEINAETGA